MDYEIVQTRGGFGGEAVIARAYTRGAAQDIVDALRSAYPRCFFTFRRSS